MALFLIDFTIFFVDRIKGQKHAKIHTGCIVEPFDQGRPYRLVMVFYEVAQGDSRPYDHVQVGGTGEKLLGHLTRTAVPFSTNMHVDVNDSLVHVFPG